MKPSKGARENFGTANKLEVNCQARKSHEPNPHFFRPVRNWHRVPIRRLPDRGWLAPVAKRVVRSCSCSCSSSCSTSAATSTERSIVPYNIRRWNQPVTGFPIVLLLLAGLRSISGKVILCRPTARRKIPVAQSSRSAFRARVSRKGVPFLGAT